MTESAVFALCCAEYARFVHASDPLALVPDPVLMLALCQQESGYDETQARLENGFYRKYTRPLKLSPTTEVLLATSWGLTQVMGENLAVMGFVNRRAIDCARSIEEYMQRPEQHIRAAMHFLKDKRAVSQSWQQALVRYNGADVYGVEVLEKYRKLRKDWSNPYGPHSVEL